MLLMLKAKYGGLGRNQAAGGASRPEPVGRDVVSRFEEEGIDGLRTRDHGGRPTEIEQRVMATGGRLVKR